MTVLADPAELARHENAITIRSILERGVSIREMIHAGIKRKDIHMVVDLQLVRFLESFNIKNSMTDFQIEEMVSTLIERYPTETLNDFQLMFRMAKHGAFGPVYNRIDISVVMEWMQRYMELKAFELEQLQRDIGKSTPDQSDGAFIKPDNWDSLTDDQRAEIWAKHRENFYANKLELKSRLDEIDQRFRDAKRRGVAGMAIRTPAEEAEFQKFRAEQMRKYKQKLDDISRRGTMGGNDGGSTGGNVPVSDATGGHDIDAISGQGSEYSKQGDGVS